VVGRGGCVCLGREALPVFGMTRPGGELEIWI